LELEDSPTADELGIEAEDSSFTSGSALAELESPQAAKVKGKAAHKVKRRANLGKNILFLLFSQIY
jgi:hypothetical protein